MAVRIPDNTELYCSKHPDYKAVMQPRVSCPVCILLYHLMRLNSGHFFAPHTIPGSEATYLRKRESNEIPKDKKQA